MTSNIILLIIIIFSMRISIAGPCDHSYQRDSAGKRCGGRSAEVIPGGRLGGNGQYIDFYERDRIWGKNNDPYDSPSHKYP